MGRERDEERENGRGGETERKEKRENMNLFSTKADV